MLLLQLSLLIAISNAQCLEWSQLEPAYNSEPQIPCIVGSSSTSWAAVTLCNGQDTVFFPSYRISWLFELDLAARFLFEMRSASSILRAVGLNEEEVKGASTANNSCIIIFDTPSNVTMSPVLSTWQGLVSVLATFSPVAFEKVSKFLPQLSNSTFAEIMGSHVSNFLENYLSPVLDAEGQSWTLEKIEATALEDLTLFAIRAFLFNEFAASNLFLGNGYSFNGNYGNVEGKEFVAPQIKRNATKYVLIKLKF